MWPLHGLRCREIWGISNLLRGEEYLWSWNSSRWPVHSHPRLSCNGLFLFAQGCTLWSQGTCLCCGGCPGEKWSLCFVDCISKGLTDVLKVGRGQDGSTWLREFSVSLAKESFTCWVPTLISEKWWYHYCLQNVGVKGRCSSQLLLLEMYLSTVELINPQYAHSRGFYTLRGDCIWKAPFVQVFWCAWALHLKGCCRWAFDWRVEI